MNRPGMGRWTPAPRVVAAAIALVLASDVAAFVALGRRVEAVTVDDAVARYRESVAGADTAAVGIVLAPESTRGAVAGTSADGGPAVQGRAVQDRAVQDPAAAGAPGAVAGPAASPQAPQRPGVYVYATDGYEQVSVLSTRHTYPAETTMTVRQNGCGVDVRWDAIEERWAQWSHCTSGRALALESFVTHHEFFEQVNERRYACTKGTYFVPPADAGQAAVRGRCRDEDTVVDLTVRLVGTERVRVGAQSVPALHIRIDETLKGGTEGTRASDSWYAEDSGLLLRRTSATEVDTEATFGKTRYEERVSLTITSLEPRR